MHRDKGVVALELRDGVPYGLHEVAAVGLGDQVRDDLGVRLTRERNAGACKRGAQLDVVLDDAVHDDGNRARLVGMRMCVLLGHPAMGGPAGVTQPCRRGRLIDPSGFAELGEVAHRVDLGEPLTGLLQERKTRGIISAVLQTLETIQDEVFAGARPDVTDDAAHTSNPFKGDSAVSARCAAGSTLFAA